MTIIEPVERLIARYDMLPEGSRVLCAVSGGADSVFLLHYLWQRGKNDIICAHYNHGLRGEESDRDQAFTQKLCGELDIPFYTERGDVRAAAEKSKAGIEETARNLRYDFLSRTAKDCGAERIATAHNADDNAETVLMNLSRGAGLQGIAGIPPVRGEIIRPILCLTRAEIEEYLARNHLPHVEDSTNGEDDCSRNRIRHYAIPALRACNEKASQNIFLASCRVRNELSYLDGMTEDFVLKSGSGVLDVTELKALGPLLASYALHRLFPNAEEGHIRRVIELAESANLHGEVFIPGHHVVRDRDVLLTDPEPAPAFAPSEIHPGQTLSLPEYEISCSVSENATQFYNSLNTFCLKYESICGTMFAMPRKGGESIRLMGRGCTKTLKKLFSEKKMPDYERKTLPLICDDKGIVALPGFGIAERCAPEKNDRVIVITCKKKDS